MLWLSHIRCDLSVQIRVWTLWTWGPDVVYVICFHKHVSLYCPVVWLHSTVDLLRAWRTEQWCRYQTLRSHSHPSHTQNKHLPLLIHSLSILHLNRLEKSVWINSWNFVIYLDWCVIADSRLESSSMEFLSFTKLQTNWNWNSESNLKRSNKNPPSSYWINRHSDGINWELLFIQ